MEETKRIRNILSGMKYRCNNPRCRYYKDYGGRGIKVCEEWNSSEAFIEWSLSHGYKDNLSIDRIDNDKGYSPDNCRWTTQEVQHNNTRRSHKVTAFGKTMTLTEWAKQVGMDRKTLRLRLEKGMTPEQALTNPLMKNGKVYKKIDFVDSEIRRFNDYVWGELKRRRLTQKNLADYLEISRSTLSYRLNGQIEWSYRDYLKVCEYFGKESKWDDMKTN